MAQVRLILLLILGLELSLQVTGQSQGSCVAQGFTACCTSSPCTGSAGGSCYCDKLCYQYGDCCSDIEDSGCHPDCAHGDVRLVQTQNYHSWRGRIEVCFNGVWGTITDDAYDSREARVVCRQLGYSDLVVRPYPNAWFGAGASSQPIFMDNIQCNGQEKRLIDCWYSTPSGDTHSEDASVRCYAFSDLNTATCNTSDIRLVGGNTDREGRLELCFGGVWSTITDDLFSTFDAIVVCRMLGYLDGYGIAFSNAYFGAGTGFISMDNVICWGSPFPLQQSIFDCVYVMAVGDSHTEDVGIRCFDSLNTSGCELGQLRLAGGTNNMEGRVEICIDGIWGTVSDDAWSSVDVQVVCRQLGFSAKDSVVFGNNMATFGQGTGPIHMKYVGCNGRNLKLIQCDFDANTNGELHQEDAGVRCTAAVCVEGTIRLVNGSDSSEGRVELCSLGQWTAVCDLRWGIQEAQVVCRQLGYRPNGSETVFPYINSHFGRGTFPYYADEATCLGTENSLLNCIYSNVINTVGCTESDAAGVRCTAGNECTHGDLRIVDAPYTTRGRLEVCLHGVWGTITHIGFSVPDSWVACRQLGFYNYSGRAFGGAFYGQGTGLVHMRNVACTGHEARLVDCPYSRDTTFNNHNTDVSILCQQVGECKDGSIRLVYTVFPLTAGRIGVCYNGVWGSVLSSNSWSGRNAQVACRQLGFNRYALAYSNAYFNIGWNVALHMTNVRCNGSEASLFNCSWSEVTVTDSSLYNDNVGVKCFNKTEATVGCSFGAVRIVSGNSSTEGRAEVCIAGQWGTICDDEWSDASANVLCGQAGFAPVGARTMRNGNYQLSPGSIVMTKVVCSGDEKSIIDCRLDGDTSKCMHSSDVGVKCLPVECTNGEVRLMNGSTSMEGRVEVCQNRRWGTVCDSNWGVNEAQVVCWQLGIASTNVYALKQSAFGSGSNYIWLNNVDCQGFESGLINCSYSTDTTMCDHSREAGVKCMPESECTPGDVRLVGGETRADGQVQICYNGQWGSIASDGWESIDAQVVCRQLGFPDITGVPVHGINFASTTAPIVMGDVSCFGNEVKLRDCRFDPDTSDHTYLQNAGVRCFPHGCTTGSISLVGGPSTTIGRLEICIGGTWGSVSNYLWDTGAATVVCQQLFGRDRVISVNALNDTTQFGMSQDPVLLHSISCSGAEEKLFDCKLDSNTEGDSHISDAGVSCLLRAITTPPAVTSVNRPTDTSTPKETVFTDQPLADGSNRGVALPIVGVIDGIILIAIIILAVILIALIISMRGKKNKEDTMVLVASASYPTDDDDETINS